MKTRSNDSAGSDGQPRPENRSQLLVSVRSLQEIDDAIAGGADIVDLKEPERGALAPTDIELWRQAARRSCETDAPPYSAALGEASEARARAASLPSGFRFAKVGPSGHRTPAEIERLWGDVRSLLASTIELVAVAYADYRSSDTLPPADVFALAAELGFARCLVDTFVKDGRSTIDHLGFDGIARLANVAADHRLWWSLAGSIRLDDLALLDQQMASTGSRMPDCYGVRGDLCTEGREGTLSVDRLRRWKASPFIQPSRVPLSS